MGKVSLLSLLLISGCATNYQVGDVSRAYCQSTNTEFRTMIKATLNSQGVNVGVDYCVIHGFVDAVVL